MSKADELFKKTCQDILDNGTNTKGEKVRPHWEDGTSAYTIKKFGIVNEYDLREEFPAITLRRIYLKSAMDEILWIYQKKSNNVNDLNSHIWDEWADEDGSIGKAYGYQMAKKNAVKGITEEGLRAAFGDIRPIVSLSWRNFKKSPSDWERVYYLREKDIKKEYEEDSFKMDQYIKKEMKQKAVAICHRARGGSENEGDWFMTQIDKVIYDLKNTPFSRRIITSMWCPEDAAEMNLESCAYSMTYNVTEEDGKLVLNAILNQRSQDMLAANGWNIAQYALLQMMLAQGAGMVPGKLIHVIADAHIYDRHVPFVEELLKRDGYPAPKVTLSDGPRNFYDFTTDDLIVTDYQYGEQIKNIPIAV